MGRERSRRRTWRNEGVLVGRSTPSSQGKLAGRIVAIVAVLVIVGVIGGLLYYLRPTPQPLALALAVTQYADAHYPPNAWAQQDVEAFSRHFDDDSVMALQGQEQQTLRDLVASLADRTTRTEDRGRPVVVYLSGLAVTRQNRVYLLPGRADPDDPSTWLPLSELLGALASGQGPRLLLLDVARPIGDARLGLLTNPVGSILHAELMDAEADGRLPFFVLTSCGQDEWAWASPELQRSVFGFFVDLALSGHADGWGSDAAKDGRVSARELIEFVRSQVPHWMAAVRGPAQSPQVYGRGRDFVLLSPPQPITPMTLPEPLGDYPKWLLDGWTERDQWEREGVFRVVPRTFLDLQHRLWLAELHWLAGENPDRVKSEFIARYEDLQKIRRESVIAPLPPHSLARVRQSGEAANPTLRTLVRSLRDRIQSTRQPLKPDDLKPLQELLTPKPDSPDKPGTKISESALAIEVFDSLVELADPAPELLREFDALLRSFPSTSRYGEIGALRFLAELDPRVQERWNDPALAGVRQAVLLAAKASEQAVAVDPRLSKWFQSDWTEADDLHRRALHALAAGGEEERRQGLSELRDVVKRYEQLSDQARALEHGWRQYEEARIALVLLADAFARLPRTPIEEQLWHQLTTNTLKLSQRLTPVAERKEIPIAEITAAADQVRFELNRMRQIFGSEEADRRIRLAGTEGGPTPLDFWRFLTAVQWAAPVRARLYQTARDSAVALAIDAFVKAKDLKPRAASPANNRKWTEPAPWRARLALDLLRLGHGLDESRREEALSPESLGTDLEPTLQRELTLLLPERFRREEDVAKKEWIGVLTHPVDLSVIPSTPGQPPLEPTPERLRRASVEFAQWLARERYQKSAERFSAADAGGLKALGAWNDTIRQQLLNYTP